MNMNVNMSTTSNMSASIQQAIFENNEGTRLVRQCEYDAAVKSFTAVLEILKPLAVIVEEQKHTQNTRHSCDDDENDDITAASTTGAPLTISFTNKSAMDTESFEDSNDMNDNKATTTPLCCTSSSSSSSSSSPPVSRTASASTDDSTTRKLKHFVFRDPVIIPTESIPSATSASLSKFLMIVMYNLALTLHLHALSSSSIVSSSSNNKKKKHMKKLFVRSRQLYELALKMHLELEDDIDPLFTLALTNNLGLIYRTMNEKVRSTICFQNMFSTMMYLLDSNQEDTSTPQSIHMEIWDGFLSNAMNILHKHTYEVAAAAA